MMASGNGAQAHGNGGGWKDRLFRWLEQQAVSTVLLFLILAALTYGVRHGVPAAIDQIQKGYERMAQENAKDRQKIRDEFEASRAKFVLSIEGLKEANDRNTDRIVNELNDLDRRANP